MGAAMRARCGFFRAIAWSRLNDSYRLDVSDRVEVSVNLDRARSLGLKIQTKLLEVARGVLDNGAIRRRR